MRASLIVPRTIFDSTFEELASRSAGWRESAAIWSGGATETRTCVTRVDYHHHLGDDHAGPLFLELPESAKFGLYQDLSHAGLRLLALLHTHPDSWVGLSPIDQANQLSSRVGFWSIVVPHFAARPPDLATLGVHERTTYGWRQLLPAEVGRRLSISG